MSEVRIYGASDDLVEIEGDIYEEFNPADTDDFLLAFSDGTVLRGKYDGVWRFVVHTAGSAKKLHGDIAWAVLGSAIARAKAPA